MMLVRHPGPRAGIMLKRLDSRLRGNDTFNNMNIKYVIVLLALSIFPLLDLLHPGIPRGHDTPDHVARIANFYQSLAEGNLIPRWAGNLNWGYGHPILMFLYPLPSYIASVFPISQAYSPCFFLLKVHGGSCRDS